MSRKFGKYANHAPLRAKGTLKQTHRQTKIALYRLNPPRGWLSDIPGDNNSLMPIVMFCQIRYYFQLPSPLIYVFVCLSVCPHPPRLSKSHLSCRDKNVSKLFSAHK